MSFRQESLPGEMARRWLARVFSPRAMESIFDPFLADLQADWLDAKTFKCTRYASWCLLSGYFSLVVQAAVCALESLLHSDYAFAPAAGSAVAPVEAESSCSRLARRLGALCAASLITLGLFVVMNSLITAKTDAVDVKPPIKVEFLRVRIPPPVSDPVRPQLPKIPESKPLPPATGIPTGEQTNEFNRLPQNPLEGVGEIGFGELAHPGPGVPADHRTAFPKVRVAPTYPQSALARGIEGWVEVEFTVTKAGSVSNPVVIHSSPSSVFDAAALRAVRRWKYEPMWVDGEAVSRPGLRTRLVFELERD